MIIENGCKKTFTVNYSDIEPNKVVKPHSILNFMQEIASDNAEQIGIGYSYLYPKNMLWFLIKYRIEFSQYPTDIKPIKIITEPRGYEKLFVYRDFEFWQNDLNIGRARSMWSVIDVNTRSIVRPQKAIPDNPVIKPYEKKSDDLIFNKIQPINRIDICEEFKVRYNDLDINGHANNGNYIIWAFETLPFEYRESHKIKTMDIVYKQETRYGEINTVQTEFVSETLIKHIIKNKQNEDLCLIETEWTKI